MADLSAYALVPRREEYATRLESKTPCCAVPVKLDDERTQLKPCPYCRNLWRIDATLISWREKPGGVESLRRLLWTLSGKLDQPAAGYFSGASSPTR